MSDQHLIDAARKEGLQKGLEVYELSRKADEHHIKEVIERARLEGIRLGLEAADNAIKALYDECDFSLLRTRKVIRALNPETIARDRLTKPAPSDLQPSSSDTIAREAVLDQLTSEAQADNMGYEND